MKILIFILSVISFASCTFSDSPKYDSTKKEAEPPVQHTGNAAILDDSLNGNAAPHHDSIPGQDTNEIKGPEGTLSGKGTNKTDIANHGVGNSTPGFKTTTADTTKKK